MLVQQHYYSLLSSIFSISHAKRKHNAQGSTRTSGTPTTFKLSWKRSNVLQENRRRSKWFSRGAGGGFFWAGVMSSNAKQEFSPSQGKAILMNSNPAFENETAARRIMAS